MKNSSNAHGLIQFLNLGCVEQIIKVLGKRGFGRFPLLHLIFIRSKMFLSLSLFTSLSFFLSHTNTLCLSHSLFLSLSLSLSFSLSLSLSLSLLSLLALLRNCFLPTGKCPKYACAHGKKKADTKAG